MPRKSIKGIPLQSLDVDDLSVKRAMGDIDVLLGVRYVKQGRKGYEHVEERPIARTLQEAQEQGWDWFSPAMNTWIRGGFKPENDPPDLHGVGFIPPAEDELPPSQHVQNTV